MGQDHVFVSYCQADAEIVYPDLDWLGASGLRLWYDGGIAAGDEWAETIGRALRDSAAVLAFVSPRWVESRHCRDEMTMALNREKPLVLVHLADTELTPGLELRLAKTQALFRHRLPEAVYREKLLAALPPIGEDASRGAAGLPPPGGGAQPVALSVGPAGRPPFLPDAVVLEEDTWLVMSGRNELDWPREHPLRVIHGARSAEPEAPGTVVVRPGRPHRLLAVVHDLGQDPICTPAWVSSALERLVELSQRMQIGGIALPLLGTRHGRLDSRVVLELVLDAFSRSGAFPRRAWLVTPSAAASAVREQASRMAASREGPRPIRVVG